MIKTNLDAMQRSLIQRHLTMIRSN
jgi:hypothetical protein